MALPAAARAVYKGTKWVKQMKKLKKGGGSTVTKIQSGTKPKVQTPTKKGLDSDYKALIAYGVGSTAASIGGGIYGQRRKKRHLEASKPYRQKKPVRGIQLGAPGTQSGTSRSKRRYK